MYKNNKTDPNSECKPKHADIMTKLKILTCVTMVFSTREVELTVTHKHVNLSWLFSSRLYQSDPEVKISFWCSKTALDSVPVLWEQLWSLFAALYVHLHTLKHTLSSLWWSYICKVSLTSCSWNWQWHWWRTRTRRRWSLWTERPSGDWGRDP